MHSEIRQNLSNSVPASSPGWSAGSRRWAVSPSRGPRGPPQTASCSPPPRPTRCWSPGWDSRRPLRPLAAWRRPPVKRRPQGGGGGTVRSWSWSSCWHKGRLHTAEQQQQLIRVESSYQFTKNYLRQNDTKEKFLARQWHKILFTFFFFTNVTHLCISLRKSFSNSLFSLRCLKYRFASYSVESLIQREAYMHIAYVLYV